MPALSPTMTEGNLVKWLKKEGDKVGSGDVIAEIETDKATMEVEAVDDGVMAKILVPEGSENVAVNDLIAILKEDGDSDQDIADLISQDGSSASTDKTEDKLAIQEDKVSELPKREPTSPATEEVSSSLSSPAIGGSDSSERIFATPLARRIASLNNIDLSQVAGTGPKGRIVKDDVEQFLAQGGDGTTKVVKGNSKPDTKPLSQCDIAFGHGGLALDNVQPSSDNGLTPDYGVVELNSMRKVIASRLSESKQNIPHFYLTVEVEIDNLLRNRAELNAKLEPYGVKVSINDFITKAVSRSLMSVKEVNAGWFDDHIRLYSSCDIAIAVAIDGGLITPIVRGAQSKSIVEISNEIKSLVKAAKQGNLKPEQFQGGTFSISNMGMLGVEQFAAVINPPQSAILAVGAGSKKLALNEGQVVEKNIIKLTLSVDHRVIDGAVAAQFMKVLKHYIESPILLAA